MIERGRRLRARIARPVLIGLMIVLAVLIVIETIELFGIIGHEKTIGGDLRYYRFVAERWLETGVYYTPDQLSAPFVVRARGHNLYPPHALYLFIPFVYLPDALWWGVPFVIVGYVVWWCRPTLSGWLLLVVIMALPKTVAQLIVGNTDMWVTCVVAGAVRWSWPGVLMSFKPSLAFLAAIGVRSRSWWIALLALGLVSVPLWSLWFDYSVVVRNSSADLSYSLGNLPFFLLPIAAWLMSSRRGDASLWHWMRQLLGRDRRAEGPAA